MNKEEQQNAAEPNYAEKAIAAINAASPGLDPDVARLYALLALTLGAVTTLEDVHDAWAIWRAATRPDHPWLVPFRDLDYEVQEMDRPFLEAIHAAVVSIDG